MRADKLVTNEEMEVMAQRLWAEQKAEIVKHVEYAVNQELSRNVLSKTRQYVQDELRQIVEPILAAKLEELKAKATVYVDKAVGKVEELILAELHNALFDYSNNVVLAMFDSAKARVVEAVGRALNHS